MLHWPSYDGYYATKRGPRMSDTASQQGVDIGKIIDARSLSGLQIRVIVLCALVVLLDGYDIQTLGLTVKSIMEEWSLPRESFKWAQSASLFGYGVGAALVAGLGDRWGRRPVLIAATAVMGLASIGTTFSTDTFQLEIWRFLTGLGFGSSIPNATALTSEYVPAARRAWLISLMYANVALGALIAGFTAPAILAGHTWHTIFIVGGVGPLILSLLLLVGAPESVRFLLEKRPGDSRIAAIVRRLAPGVDARTVRLAEHAQIQSQSVMALIAPAYRPRTTLLWTVFALNLFALYFLISWLTPMLSSAGWAASSAQRGGVMIQAGGIVFGLLLAWGVDRGRTVPGMVTAYLITAIGLGLFLVVPSTSNAWWVMLFVIGAGTSGTQLTLNALAAAFYPPAIRATGVGWAVAIGRFGAYAGPFVGGLPVIAHLPTAQTLGLLVVPVLMCAASTLLLPRVWRG
jgi:MFS transporter, AAHS family, 4-hydroxybenzoate transporter